LLIGFHFLLNQKFMEATLVKYVLTRQLRLYTRILSATVPFLALSAWPQLFSQASELTVYVLLTVAYIHFYSIPSYPKYGASMALVHIIALAVLLMLNVPGSDDLIFWMLPIIVVVLLIIRAAATLMAARSNQAESPATRALAYLRVIPAFLIATGIFVIAYFGLDFIFPGLNSINWWQALVGLFIIHICWNHQTGAIPKWLLSMLLAATFFNDPVLLVLGGVYLYALSEYLNLYLRKVFTTARSAAFLSGQFLITGSLLAACGLSQIIWFSTLVANSATTWAAAMQLFSLLLVGYLMTIIFERKAVVSPHRWFSELVNALVYLLLPIGFYGYYLVQDSSIALALLLAAASIVLIHQVFVFKRSSRYAHLVLAHLVIPWLLYSLPDQLLLTSTVTNIVTNIVPALPGLILGAFLILFLVSYSLEKSIAFNVYARPVVPWMVTTATAFLLSVLLLFPASFETAMAYLVLPVIHFGFRRFNNLTACVARLVASMVTGFALASDFFTALVIGTFIYSGWELLTWRLDRIQWLRFRGDPAGESDFILTLQWCLAGVIVLHLFTSILLTTDYQNVLLYSLLPLLYFLHLRRDRQYLSYAVLGAFVYANGFMFYELRETAGNYSLTGLHLTSLSFLFSIAVFSGFRRLLR